MIINHNMPALNTYRQLSANNFNTQKSLEKLSSGLRINKAGDDAAGLAISEKMRGQIRGLDQAARNAQDGISLINTAEGSLSETHSILQRMRELATQSANDTNVAVDRSEIQKEINQLTSEINRIGNTTEFNTQKLLKGTNLPVTTTAQTTNTITNGVAGVPVGATSALAVNTKSVAAISSSTFVQGASSATNGAVGTTVQTTTSVAGKSSSAIMAELTFTSNTKGTTLNGKTISIVQESTASTATSITSDASSITIKIGTDADGNSLLGSKYSDPSAKPTVGDLYTEITNSADYAASGFTVAVSGASDDPLANYQKKVVSDTTLYSSEMAGGVNETLGVNTFSLTSVFKEAGDTIQVGGQTFTAVSGAYTGANQFDISKTHATATMANAAGLGTLSGLTDETLKVNVGGTDYKFTTARLQTWTGGTASELATFLGNADTVGDGTGTKLSSVALISSDGAGKITITDKTGGATGAVTITAAGTATAALKTTIGASADVTNGANGSVAATLTSQATELTRAINANSTLTTRFSTANVAGAITMTERTGQATGTALPAVTVAGSGADNKLIVNDASGTNLKTIKIQQAGGDALAVSGTGGNLTISLANASAYKNTAAAIQTAVQALGVVDGTDFSKYTFTSTGDWDTKETGSNIASASSTIVGGTQEVKGDYSFDITKAFAAGDKVNIKGQIFTAVNGGAVGAKGQFDISSSDTAVQAASLRNAIALNSTLNAGYTVSGSGSTVKLTENIGTGTDMTATDVAVKGTGVQGEYSAKLDTLLTNGAAFVLDGKEITVSNKTTHSGYSNGTAIKEASSVAAQTAEIANAINTNTDLKGKYTASVNASGELVLKQNADQESGTAPQISTKSSALGKFSATMQIGANAGQSVTVDINDMRSASIAVSGDGSYGTVTAKDGKVASYVTTANVTNGTDNTSVEFSLDVSTHEKATAAISVINDAIETVSAERSKLGAFTNRLEHTITNLGTSSENLTAAESRIRDVDMAKEMMQFQKNNILSQAAQAMLAQANQQPQGVLQLLR